MDEHNLQYPVLYMSQVDILIFGVRDNSDQLTFCSKGAINRGEFVNSLVVDANGKVYKILGVKSIQRAGRYWGFELSFFQPWRATLDIDDKPSQVGDEVVRKRILASLTDEQRSETWKVALEGSSVSYRQFVERIENAASLKEIVELFSTYIK
jgi:hypothetical protein